MSSRLELQSIVSGISVLLVAAVFAGCSGGGGGGGGGEPVFVAPGTPLVEESEPNDTRGQAAFLPDPGVAAIGTTATVGDEDYWAFDALAGDWVRIVLDAVSTDQVSWEAACNLPQLSVLYPNGDEFLRHDTGDWEYPAQDLDMPVLRIEEDGTHYIKIENRLGIVSGGVYVLQVQFLDLGNVQEESGGDETDNVDAEEVNPGFVRGSLEATSDVGNRLTSDVYAFDTDGPSIVFQQIYMNRAGIYRDSGKYVYPSTMKFDDTTVVRSGSSGFTHDQGMNHLLTDAGTYFLTIEGDTLFHDGPNPYLLDIDVSPVEDEQEPNDIVADAMPVVYGDCILGEHEATGNANDYYAFEGIAGDMIRLWEFDDDNCQGSGSPVDFDLLGTNGTSPLEVTTEQGIMKVTKTILEDSGTHYIRCARTSGGEGPYGFKLELVMRSVPEAEPNDVDAESFGQHPARFGTISTSSDVDRYLFAASAGTVNRILLHAEEPTGATGYSLAGHGSDLDEGRIRVFDLEGNLLAQAEAQTDRNCSSTRGLNTLLAPVRLSFVALESDTYVLEVSSMAGGSDTHTYVVEIR